jgi:hypothetical protein
MKKAMKTMSEDVYIDILTRVQVAAAQMDGEQKEFYDEIINEISSLRNALQIFSDEFDKMQQQDDQRAQIDESVFHTMQ